MSAPRFVLMASLFLCAGNAAFAQSAEKESAAVLELGGAGARSLTEGQSSLGPTVAVEVTPIENRLELEAGVTPLFRRHSTEWSVDLLFKKPWTLSDRVVTVIHYAKTDKERRTQGHVYIRSFLTHKEHDSPANWDRRFGTK